MLTCNSQLTEKFLSDVKCFYQTSTKNVSKDQCQCLHNHALSISLLFENMYRLYFRTIIFKNAKLQELNKNASHRHVSSTRIATTQSSRTWPDSLVHEKQSQVSLRMSGCIPRCHS